MSIADELKTLKELHASGALSDQEFADAKTKLLSGTSPTRSQSTRTEQPVVLATQPISGAQKAQVSGSKMLDPRENIKALGRIIVLLGVLGGAVYVFLRMTAGEDAANRVVATAVKAPIDLADTVVNLQASSWSATPLQLPYAGTLSINATVTRGNPLEIFVATPEAVSTAKAKGSFEKTTYFPDLSAKKARSFSKSARMQAGTYYLVFFDSTLGVLSSSSSDVTVKARLLP